MERAYKEQRLLTAGVASFDALSTSVSRAVRHPPLLSEPTISPQSPPNPPARGIAVGEAPGLLPDAHYPARDLRGADVSVVGPARHGDRHSRAPRWLNHVGLFRVVLLCVHNAAIRHRRPGFALQSWIRPDNGVPRGQERFPRAHRVYEHCRRVRVVCFLAAVRARGTSDPHNYAGAQANRSSSITLRSIACRSRI